MAGKPGGPIRGGCDWRHGRRLARRARGGRRCRSEATVAEAPGRWRLRGHFYDVE
jgi:hypothetical protein